MSRNRLPTLLAILVAAAVSTVVSAAGPTVTIPAGSSVAWDSWLEERGPVAVVLWASWSPEADEVLAEWAGLQKTAEDAGISLVLVSVQESVQDASRALDRVDIAWLHDRYGSLLKHHRVVQIPALVVVAADGKVLARLEPTARALAGWNAE